MSIMFSSFSSSELSEKFADPVQISGSSRSGSISRNFVWTKKCFPGLAVVLFLRETTCRARSPRSCASRELAVLDV